MTRIILNGFFGRMGSVVRELTRNDPKCEIVAGVDTAEIGGSYTFPVYPNLLLCEMPADVVLDFSDANALAELLKYGLEKQIPLVICTTGYTREEENRIKETSEHIAVFRSPNMSIGVNLLANIINRTAKLLYESRFDVEIIEKHHNQKLDAPSGTALWLADTVNDALDGKMDFVYGRSGKGDGRSRNEIGIHAMRGGSIIGDHSVIFAGQNELIEIKHTAQSREIFAVGAVRASCFMKDKPPGMYDMQDLINSSEVEK